MRKTKRDKRPCVICRHSAVREITEARSSGGSLRAVARQYGVSSATLSRHERDCGMAALAPPPAALVMPAVPADIGDTPPAVALRELAEFHEGARTSYTEALTKKDHRNVAALLLQLRRNLELRARLEAALRPDDRPPAERLRDNPEWQDARRILFRVLDRHPEAKDDIRCAFEAGGVDA